MSGFLAALDQGTTSTRCIVFDLGGREVGRHQMEHRQIFPRPGWVEHDPREILANARSVVAVALERAGISPADLAGLGVTNQRETTVVWDRRSGRPLYNAIVWQDTRTAARVRALERSLDAERVRARTGLPPATYFSATKLQWVLENVEGARAAAERGDALFGTIDSWLLWHFSGGALHQIDVTNASRTQLCDLETLSWSAPLLELFGVPPAMLPEIVPAIGEIGTVQVSGSGAAAEVAVGGVLGDQHAAMFGHRCVEVGDAKCTYGTGSFLLCNTGHRIVRSRHGLLSTLCYQRAGQQPTYALEGAIAVSGSALQWLRDQLGIIASAAESAVLASQVEDTGGLYFVPAFSGLFAPHWRSDARGVIVGLTAAHSRAHLVRATLEAICLQTRDLLDAMEADSGRALSELRVDGGVSTNDVCMQLQADILGVPVQRAATSEVTALGAARAAGIGVGVLDEAAWGAQRAGERFRPSWAPARRARTVARWHQAIERSLGWAEEGGPEEDGPEEGESDGE